MTDLEKVLEHLKNCGFKGYVKIRGLLDGFLYATLPLVGSHQKDLEGNHYLISGMTVVNYSGVNTKKGKIGCLCFYYTGIKREKYRKRADSDVEILKKVSCYKTAKEAIEEFDKWSKETQVIRNDWKKIL